MLKFIGIAVAALIAGLLAFAATRPDTFSVQRATVIHASPAKVFALINDFHRWTAWSPWEKLDPAMQRTYSGAPYGVGAVYEWDGSSKVGKGRMELTQSAPPSTIAIKLDFIKPFEGHNTTEFSLLADGNDTQVTWRMYGPSPYISKLMGIFINMDTMIGKDFEAGLANLKNASEKPL